MTMVRRVAWRFVFDKKNKSADSASKGFVSFISTISVLGLALGVTALLVVTSVMNGFERELKSRMTAFHGHVLLFSRSEPVSNPAKYVEEIYKNFPKVKAITPYIFAEVMLSPITKKNKSGVAGVVVEGVDQPTFSKVSSIGSKLVTGRMPQFTNTKIPEVTLGFEVAQKLHAEVGDEVLLTLPYGKSEKEPILQKLVVSGIVRIGMYDYDNKYVLMDIQNLQEILSLDNKVNAFKILTEDPETSMQTTMGLNDKYLYPLRAKDWSSLNRNLFYAIRLEKAVISIILLAITLVASFNIISTLIMMVHDKKRQVAMLKALGLGRRQTFLIFLSIGSAISVLGMLLGLLLAYGLCALLRWKSLVDLPADIYILARLPVEIRTLEWTAVCLLAIALAILSTVWPSYQISRKSPMEGLRYE